MSWPISQAWELGSERSWWRSAGPGSTVLGPSVVRELAGEQRSGEAQHRPGSEQDPFPPQMCFSDGKAAKTLLPAVLPPWSQGESSIAGRGSSPPVPELNLPTHLSRIQFTPDREAPCIWGSGKGNPRPGWWEMGGGWLARPTLPQSAARRERITTARRSSVCHARRAPSRREKGSSPATFALGVMPTGLLEPPTSPHVQVPGEQTIQSGLGWAVGCPWARDFPIGRLRLQATPS